jgi:hypothetical protein
LVVASAGAGIGFCPSARRARSKATPTTRTETILVAIHAGVAAAAMLATTATDEIRGFVVTDRPTGVELLPAAASPETPAAIEALFRPVGTLHGSTASISEGLISGLARRTLLLAVGRVSRRLLASGRRFETLFQLGTIALELLLELVTVTTDSVAEATLAQTRVGATARGDLAALLYVIRISPTQLAQRLCRITHRGGVACRRRRRGRVARQFHHDTAHEDTAGQDTRGYESHAVSDPRVVESPRS